MNKVVSFGSSFTEGGGLYFKDVHRLYKGAYNLDNFRNYTFGGLLAKKLNVPFLNFGKCGAGFDTIFRKFWDYYNNNDCSDTLFLIEIPGSWYRLEGYSKEFQEHLLINITSLEQAENIELHIAKDYVVDEESLKYKHLQKNAKNYLNEWYDIVKLKDNYENLIFTFLSFLQQKKINFIFLPFVQDVLFFNKLKKHIDIKKYCVEDKDLMEWIIDNENSIRHEVGYDDGHLGFYGHEKLSQKIYDKLNGDSYER